ncbi:cytochrome P450 [Astrocystis sublimbata]|nr:cytochrome P450 [Astrocystis sublimbata]
MIFIWDLKDAAVLAAVLFGVYFCLVLAYRLLLHPLRKFPGPLFALVSDLYGAYFAITRDLHLVTLRDHQCYGTVVRQGPNKLVFNTVAAFRAIHQNEHVTKSHLYLCGNRSLKNKSVFVAIDKDVHRSKRKVVGSVISDRAMRNFEPVMIEQIDIFLREILRTCDHMKIPNPVNIHTRCKNLGMDIVGLLSFGYEFHMQTSDKNRSLHRSMEYMSWRSNVLLQLPVLSWLYSELWLNLIFYPTQIATYRLLQTMIKERLALDKHARFDLCSTIGESIYPDKSKLETSDLWSEATFFLQAGGDTTSTCLSAAFFYLSWNKACYDKLKTEIRTNFVAGSEIRGGAILSKCHYLRACIDETLRLSPPAPGTLWREQEQDDQSDHLIIDGHVVPKGTTIGINIYALHHNKEYFPEPFSYRPERWIDDDGALIHLDAFAAFLAGPRGCAGKAMAYLEASVVLAKTIWYFDFNRAEGALGTIGGGVSGHRRGRHREDEYQIHDIFTAACNGPYLTFHPREQYIQEIRVSS